MSAILQHAYRVVLSSSTNGHLNLPLTGGSEDSQFVYIDAKIDPNCFIYHPIVTDDFSPQKRSTPCILHPGDVLLKLNDFNLAGWTLYETERLAAAFSQKVTLTLLPLRVLPAKSASLAGFLKLKFPPEEESPERSLQESIRECLYQRVTPVTTRPPSLDEIPGTHYNFINLTEFQLMEKEQAFIEHGHFNGHYYGTPKPKLNLKKLDQMLDQCLLGIQQKSCLKQYQLNGGLESPRILNNNNNGSVDLRDLLSISVHNLNPMGPMTHSGATSPSMKVSSPVEMLPEGWERVDDPLYGIFYIDHRNKLTQYDSPTFVCDLEKSNTGYGFTVIGGFPERLQLKTIVPGGVASQISQLSVGDQLIAVNGVSVEKYTHAQFVQLLHAIPIGSMTRFVLMHHARRDEILPSLAGEPGLQQAQFIKMRLEKADNGFGFTIVDYSLGQKVKEILDPVRCSLLKVGDVLVELNNVRIKEMPHYDVVQMLKDCPVGLRVDLLVMRPASSCAQLADEETALFAGTPLVENQYMLVSKPGVTAATTRSFSPPPSVCSSEEIYEKCNFPIGAVMLNHLHQHPHPRNNNNNGNSLINTSSFDDSMLDSRYSSGRQRGDAMLYQPANGLALDFADKLSCRQRDASRPLPKLPPNEPQIVLATTQPFEHEEEFVTELNRLKSGFGFKVAVRSASQTGSIVKELLPGGAAERAGIVRCGDEIVTINGHDVRLFSYADVVSMLENSPDRLLLGLRRRSQILQKIQTPVNSSPPGPCYLVTLQRDELKSGFGFVLVGSTPKLDPARHHPLSCSVYGSPGDLRHEFIGNIVPGSPAAKCGQLAVGDRILAVNNVDVTRLTHDQLISLIRDSGMQIRLLISKDERPHSSPNSAVKRITLFTDSLRGNVFGFSMQGGQELQQPLSVLSLAPGGPAHLDGRMQVGDIVVNINGQATHGMKLRHAIDLVKSGGNTLQMVLLAGGATGQQGTGSKLRSVYVTADKQLPRPGIFATFSRSGPS